MRSVALDLLYAHSVLLMVLSGVIASRGALLPLLSFAAVIAIGCVWSAINAAGEIET